LEKQWMRIHGVDLWDPGQQWITTTALGAEGGVAAMAQGRLNQRPVLIQDGVELPLPENVTYDSLLFAQHLRSHAETFGLPLPEDQEKVAKPKSSNHNAQWCHRRDRTMRKARGQFRGEVARLRTLRRNAMDLAHRMQNGERFVVVFDKDADISGMNLLPGYAYQVVYNKGTRIWHSWFGNSS
jgi:hypothetical protein